MFQGHKRQLTHPRTLSTRHDLGDRFEHGCFISLKLYADIGVAFLFGGLIVTETVFNIPGVARFLVEAIRWRDYPMVQNLVMFMAMVIVTMNLLIDLGYMLVDPRIRAVHTEGRSRGQGSDHFDIAQLHRARGLVFADTAYYDPYLPGGTPRESV